MIGFGSALPATNLSQNSPAEQHTMTDDEERDALLCQVESSDLVSFGLIPEFTGRLPVVVGLNSVTEKMLLEILTQPQNCLVSQYTALFAMDGVSCADLNDLNKLFSSPAAPGQADLL